MDLDLKELAATLAIGAFFIFGVEFINLNFFRRTISSKFITNVETSQYVVGAFAIALCFVFGMVVEDVSNKFVDENSWLSASHLLEPDDEIKTDVFFGDKPWQSFSSPFAEQASKYRLLGAHTDRRGEALEDYYFHAKCGAPSAAPDPTPDRHDLTSVAKKFYYNAKNVAYQQDNYYDELKKIQLRVDFSRALVAVAVCLLIVVFAAFAVKGVMTVAIKLLARPAHPAGATPGDAARRARATVWLQEKREYLFAAPKMQWGRLCAACLILGSALLLARFAYSSEEAEFDKRAYGYYLTLKTDGVAKRHESVCQPPPGAPTPVPAPASPPVGK